MNIEVIIPGMLRDCVGGKTKFTLDANTLADAIDRLRADYPLLRYHVFTDTGTIRQHVLIFYNDTSTRWIEDLNIPLKAGDRIQIVQAVSGG